MSNTLNDLLSSGLISQQDYNSLSPSITNATDKIDQGNTNAAVGMLNAAINKVNAMKNIDEAVRTTLLNQLNNLIVEYSTP